MTKKKVLVSKLFVVLIALTLISFCFLGNTFARYTSGTDAEATASIAKWNVSFTQPESITASFGNLAPNANGWSSQTDVTSTSTKVHIATITYDLGVNATLTTGDIVKTVTYKAGENFAGQTTAAAAGIDAETDITDLFTITLYAGDNSSDTDTTTVWTTSQTLTGSGELYIFAAITWTTPYGSYNSATAAEAADKIDTWIGANVTSINITFKLTAVQAAA